MRMDADKATFPLIDLSSKDMACNVNGDTGVARTVVASAGDEFTFNWRTTPDGSKPGTIDRGHKGPCAVYMKKVDSPMDPGSGDGWFKIWQDGYDASTDKWCTDKLVDTNGLLSVNTPSDIAQGYYLVRPELLALHAADSQHQPQYYTGCAQVFIKSSGSVTPPTVSIPGYNSLNDKSDSFNIYDQPMALPYPIPGPAPYATGNKKRSLNIHRRDTTPNIIGLKPDNCICQNGNWCGVEVSSSNDQASCWKTAQECWTQGKECYDRASPAGNEGCRAWEKKCSALNDACNAGDYNQPANKGKDLTPASFFMNIACPAPYIGQGQAAGGGPDHSGSAGYSPPAPAPSSAQSSVAAPIMTAASSTDTATAASSADSSSTAMAEVTTPAGSGAAAASSTTSSSSNDASAAAASSNEPTTTSTTYVATTTITATTTPMSESTATSTEECDDASATESAAEPTDDGSSEEDCTDEMTSTTTDMPSASGSAKAAEVQVSTTTTATTTATGAASAANASESAKPTTMATITAAPSSCFCAATVTVTQTITVPAVAPKMAKRHLEEHLAHLHH